MPLPFELAELSRGYAEVTGEARALGVEAAAAAARGLSAVLDCEVALRARAVPGPARPRAAAARVALELAAVPARAALEVEPALVVRLVELLGGEPGDGAGATSLTPMELAALDLFVLAALDGICTLPGVEEPLAPRLSEGTVEVPGALAVEIEVVAGAVSGRARLLLPPAALRLLRGDAPPGTRAGSPSVPASLRSGAVTLTPEELDALAPGDVVVLEPAPGGVEELVLPGGRRLRGRREDGAFRLEETSMTERCAQLPITLDVELARVEVPVAELARLEPGGILPLAVDRRGLVTLRAGERAVARGELVELEGALGVRILSIEVAP
jgi:type III secretion protein Q